MALWTPYADEALDLTKKETAYPQYTQYAPEYYTPIGQLSPISSGYESVIYTPIDRHITLSPPASPERSGKRSFDMLDVDSLSDDPDFQAFERNALRVMAEKNGGSLLGNNPKMRRTVQPSGDANDDVYRRQRERNNFAAKQSRDRRKLREIHLALKVSYLRKEVASLKVALRSRTCSRCQRSCLC